MHGNSNIYIYIYIYKNYSSKIRTRYFSSKFKKH